MTWLFGKPARLCTLERSVSDQSSQTGLGWMREEMKAGVYWWHNGETFGSHKFIGFSPSVGFGMVLLQNESPDDELQFTKAGLKALRLA